jgi:hypothetical protein
MRNFVRKCSCNSKACKYCRARNRYEREMDAFKHRASLRRLRVKDSEEFVRGVLRDFNDRLIGVDELLVILDG